MARMMDSLIIDSLSTTPYAFTKITTHRPVRKATSTNHLPTNGMSSSTSSTQARNTFHHNNKKIPTQGNAVVINQNFVFVSCSLSFTYIRVCAFSPPRTIIILDFSFASSQVCWLTSTLPTSTNMRPSGRENRGGFMFLNA